MSKPWHRNVPARVTEYLSMGGLVNPELMDHQAVRDILIDARDVIEVIARGLDNDARVCEQLDTMHRTAQETGESPEAQQQRNSEWDRQREQIAAGLAKNREVTP